jgi:hypothetical protein
LAKPKTSEKQRTANRANAARSTGPRTPEGKARSAQNSRKHGFAGAVFGVVRLEELDAVSNLKADLVSVYHPANAQELFAIERIALAQQALLRVARLEAGLFTCALDRALDRNSDAPIRLMSEILVSDIDVLRAQNRNFALAEGFRQMVSQSDAWKLFLRYQAQTERLYRRAIEEFERLKALRAELPNEPISEAEPEPAQPLEPPPSEPLPPLDKEIPGHVYDPLDDIPGTPPPPKPLTEPIVLGKDEVYPRCPPGPASRPRAGAESNAHPPRGTAHPIASGIPKPPAPSQGPNGAPPLPHKKEE